MGPRSYMAYQESDENTGIIQFTPDFEPMIAQRNMEVKQITQEDYDR